MRDARRYALGILLLVFTAQWVVPISMIRSREQVIDHGQEVRFRVQPVDPYDPFRGRYVRINARPVINEELLWPDALKRGQRVFIRIELDADGFATGTAIEVKRPEDGLYLEGKVRWPGNQNIDFGLTRYYMNEKMAPATERLVAEQLRTDAAVSIMTHVLKGDCVITGLFVDGVPVESLITLDE